MIEDQILTAVIDEKLLGTLEVDIKVPDDLKSKFGRSDQTRYEAAFPDGKEELGSTYRHPRTCFLR